MSDDTFSKDMYRPRPETKPVIIPIEKQHVPRVKTLWKNRFGAPEETMENWLSDVLTEGKPTEGFVACDGGNVLGFGLATISGPDYVDKYLDHPEVSVDGWPKTGILHMVCVDQSHEGQGVGSQLVETRLRWLAAEGVDGVLAVSWHREDNRDSRPLLRKYGFEAAAVAEDFYETAHDEVHCVDCEDVCECGASVFVRKFCERNDHDLQPDTE